MQYFANIAVGEQQSVRAFNYDATNKVLVAVDDRVEFEQGADYFAIKVLGEYSFVWDSDGALAGDFLRSTSVYPRLEFFQGHCGISQRIAVLTADGRLATPAVTESDTALPAGLNLWDEVVLNADGLTARQVQEVLWLANQGDYITSGGLLIRVRL